MSLRINRLSTYPTKWSNTLKQCVGNLPTICLNVFDHFVGLVLKWFICSGLAFKAFIKPIEEPQRSVKIKISVNVYFNINFLNAQDEKV